MYQKLAYAYWNIGMSVVYRPNGESSVPCHSSMDGTVSKKCAVDVV